MKVKGTQEIAIPSKKLSTRVLTTCQNGRFSLLLHRILKELFGNMICFPNAKINLGLRVVERRPDGYHNIETVFYPIGLCDALEVHFSESDATTLNVDGLITSDLSSDFKQNIVYKAYSLLNAVKSIKPMTMHLYKKIPTGAGLGGGSSDGANALKIISKLNGLLFSDEDLEHISAQIGADCAFFIKNNPIFAKGIGTEFEPVQLNLSGYFLVLVKPTISVSTAEAYALVKPKKADNSLKELVQLPLNDWKHLVFNDFESSVFAQYPEIEKIKDKMYAQGAIYASMSGSGSSVFGLFNHAIDLKSEFDGMFYWSEYLKF